MLKKWNQFLEEYNKDWEKVPRKPDDFSIFLIGVIILKLTASISPVKKNTHKRQPAKIPPWAWDLWRLKAWVCHQESAAFLPRSLLTYGEVILILVSSLYKVNAYLDFNSAIFGKVLI